MAESPMQSQSVLFSTPTAYPEELEKIKEEASEIAPVVPSTAAGHQICDFVQSVKNEVNSIDATDENQLHLHAHVLPPPPSAFLPNPFMSVASLCSQASAVPTLSATTSATPIPASTSSTSSSPNCNIHVKRPMK